MPSGNAAPTKDRFFIALALCFVTGGTLHEIIPGIRKGEISLFGFGPFSERSDVTMFWAAVAIYSFICFVFLFKGLPVVLGYASNEEELIQASETTRGK